MTSGALVGRVEPGSPAQKAGIKAGTNTITFEGDSGVPEGGDVIVSVAGKPVTDPTDLANFIALRNPGEKIAIGLLRGTRA